MIEYFEKYVIISKALEQLTLQCSVGDKSTTQAVQCHPQGSQTPGWGRRYIQSLTFVVGMCFRWFGWQ